MGAVLSPKVTPATTGRGNGLAFAPVDAAAKVATTHIFQTAYSSVPQVDAVAEGVTKLLDQVHGLSVPQVAAAAEVVTKHIFQIAYSSQFRK